MKAHREIARKRVPREAQQRVERISFKCLEFHVSGFKLFDSGWLNLEVKPETWNLKLETPLPGERRFTHRRCFTRKSGVFVLAAELHEVCEP